MKRPTCLIQEENCFRRPHRHPFLCQLSSGMELSPLNKSFSWDVIQERLELSYHNDPYRFYICLGLLAIIETYGNACLACMIIYEKFGMDPQKRTINNQLLSKLCFLFILNNISVCPLMTIRCMFSPLGKSLSTSGKVFKDSFTYRQLLLGCIVCLLCGRSADLFCIDHC